MGRITDKGRALRGRGLGEGADYVPWIKAGQKEFRNSGTSSRITDYKTGRRVHLLSRGELGWWYELRWRDDVEDIREQFPLDLEETMKIADELGYLHPVQKGEPKVMTTDLLVTFTDGSYCAYNVKASRSALERPREIEKIAIEQSYWERQGVGFKMAFREDLDEDRVRNLRDVAGMYDINLVHDDIGLIRHLIATKQIKVDMGGKILDYRRIKAQFEKEILEWKRQNMALLAAW